MLSAIETKYPRLILHKLKSTCEYYYIANIIDLPRTVLSRKANMRQFRILPQGNWLGFPIMVATARGF